MNLEAFKPKQLIVGGPFGTRGVLAFPVPQSPEDRAAWHQVAPLIADSLTQMLRQVYGSAAPMVRYHCIIDSWSNILGDYSVFKFEWRPTWRQRLAGSSAGRKTPSTHDAPKTHTP